MMRCKQFICAEEKKYSEPGRALEGGLWTRAGARHTTPGLKGTQGTGRGQGHTATMHRRECIVWGDAAQDTGKRRRGRLPPQTTGRTTHTGCPEGTGGEGGPRGASPDQTSAPVPLVHTFRWDCFRDGEAGSRARQTADNRWLYGAGVRQFPPSTGTATVQREGTSKKQAWGLSSEQK